jgi:hypothetical protein
VSHVVEVSVAGDQVIGLRISDEAAGEYPGGLDPRMLTGMLTNARGQEGTRRDERG